MKTWRVIGALILACGLSSSGLALADGRSHHHRHGHSHSHLGIGLGFHFGSPFYYPPPYYYPYPPVVVVPAPAPPPVYIEQAPVTAENYWYYCYSPEGYYPYVKECAGGWHQVEPQPSR